VNRLSAQDPDHVPDYRTLFSLEERVFVVLGGGAGIGRQSSHALAQAGATVVVVDTDRTAAAAVAAEVGGIALTADVTRRDSVEGLFADAARHAGPVRGVVDIVGVASLGPLAALDDAGWDRQFDLVLRHAYLALQIGGRAIAEAGGGVMVLSRLMVLREEYVTGSRSTSITSSYRVTHHMSYRGMTNTGV